MREIQRRLSFYTERQIDVQADRQKGLQEDNLFGQHMDRQKERQIDIHLFINGQHCFSYRENNCTWIDRQIDGQADR